MKISDAVRPDFIFLGLEVKGADDAIAAVSRELGTAAKLDPTLVECALTERETLGSTSVGNGFAIPHCKLPNLEEIVVALAQLSSGVDFRDKKNHEPVSFFFVVLSPPDQPTEHLQVLSQIARILKNTDLRDQLRGADNAESVIRAIRSAAEQEGL